MRRFCVITVLSMLLALPLGAQAVDMFRPLYFIGGVPLQGPVDKTTADMKFQFSVGIPLWKNIAGHEGLDAHFGYTQVSIWDFFDESSPFKDNTYIPGFYLNVPLKRDRLQVGFEHRSNGRPMRGTTADTFSRSVNYVFGEYGAFLENGLIFKTQLRAGFGWYDEDFTQEVFWRYLGYADFTVGYQKNKLEFSVKATPVFGPFNCNVEAAAAYKLGPLSIFTQFNYGYGEALCDWVRGFNPAPYIRLGILFGSLFN